jgi:hypothetical protein
MAVEVQPSIAGRVVGFIDDLKNVFLGMVKNCTRVPTGSLLVMYITSRPHARNETEPIEQWAKLSMAKLLEEQGSPGQKQTSDFEGTQAQFPSQTWYFAESSNALRGICLTPQSTTCPFLDHPSACNSE